MSDVFYLRPVAPPITPADVQGMAQHAGGCFDLHGVTWEHSFLSADGGRMLCWYRAPDAESARLALRELGSNMNAVWAGTVTGEGPRSAPIAAANVVAEILLDVPLTEDELASRTAALERQPVKLVRGFLSNRRTQWLGVLEAPDEQAARTALERADLPVESVWACTVVTPQRRQGLNPSSSR